MTQQCLGTVPDTQFRKIKQLQEPCACHAKQPIWLQLMERMFETLSTINVRQRIGEMLDRVALREEFIIERKGNTLAALVPVERLEQMRRFA